ncbi:MAG: adenosylcobinamide-phosphate synthase CbiB [Calditerrivibrio sp.]|nr:adenosylcobinamide-phosphate synthase CbiB [Calditerrivibrio sp.]
MKGIYLTIAFFIDRFIGDPEFRYHPIRGIGLLAFTLEKTMNKGGCKKLKGFLFNIILTVGVYLFFLLLDFTLISYSHLYHVYHIVMLYFGISSYELIKRVKRIDILLKSDIEKARRELSMIVGRDTKTLEEQGIRRAMLETLSENLSDGFVAPVFYYLLGGLPLLYFYKTVNTLDSMVGYKSERYREFGYFSAKLDDLLNFIPARLTALLFFLATLDLDVLKYIKKYGRNHTSPNSGYPEAALAGVLKCSFGGPNYYNGKLVEKPYIGENNRKLTPQDTAKSLKTVSIASYIFFVITIITLELL